MKEIQPVVYPLNMGTATFLNCTGQDNFSTNVTIYYQLLTSSQLQLQSGNLTIDSFDYEAYNTSPNGNDYIYNWTAEKLGVTLV
jgi:hypothetical protein